MKISDQLKQSIFETVKTTYPEVEIKLEDIILEHPTVEEFGDYSTNIALRLAKQLKLNPQEMAEKIIAGQTFPATASVRAGFINFTLPKEFLVSEMQKVDKDYGKRSKNNQKIVIELVSPNINKPLHIGHLRNAALGMSLANIYEATGWEVVKDEINNDRGLHIMKAAYGYLLFGQKEPQETKDWKELLAFWTSDKNKWQSPEAEKKKQDFFVGEYYVLGEKFLNENEEFAGKQLAEMLQAWEAEEKTIWQLWQKMSDWVHSGIDVTYARIGVKHDKKWYEHLLYKEGRTYILEAVDKGIFERLPDGAVQANLKPYGLDNKILIRRDGTAIYMTFDIALTRHKVEEFKANKYVWVVGNDQVDHFKRLFVIFDMLGLGKKEDFYHLAHGMVRVPGGKMSSRLGNVILADDLLDKIKEMAEKFGEETAEDVAVGAVKYAMLKVDPVMNVTFDLDKSVSLEGDSGPYLQYMYARARSVIARSKATKRSLRSSEKIASLTLAMTREEISVLRYLYRFPEVVEQAAKQYAPNILCTYLFELAKRFNNLYNNCPIIGNDFRLALTAASAQVIKNGLNLLGIVALEKM